MSLRLCNPLRGPSKALLGIENLLDDARLGAWLRVLAGITAALTVCLVVMSSGGVDPWGKPLGTDFTSFYAASWLARAGVSLSVYDISAHRTAEMTIFGREFGHAQFLYPPIYLLVCLPFAFLTYFQALVLWLLSTFIAYYKVVRRIAGDELPTLALVMFTGVFVNLGHGQNAFLTTALFGGAWLALEQRPILAGVLIGALAFKPQIGLAIPVALVAAGQWRTIAAAAATVAGLCLLVTVEFGLEIWPAYFSILPHASAVLSEDLVGAHKMQSVYAAVRLLGGSDNAASIIQMIVAVAALSVLFRAVRMAASPVRASLLLAVPATFLSSPFLLDYDLTLLAIPLAWLAREGRSSGFNPGEKLIALLAFVLPLVSRGIAQSLSLPLAPIVILLLSWVLLRRVAPAALQLHPIRKFLLPSPPGGAEI
jgi:glycosyl transferase family 87